MSDREKFPWSASDESEARALYWSAWTGDPKWIRAARQQAEARVACGKLKLVILAPVEKLVDRLATKEGGTP